MGKGHGRQRNGQRNSHGNGKYGDNDDPHGLKATALFAAVAALTPAAHVFHRVVADDGGGNLRRSAQPVDKFCLPSGAGLGKVFLVIAHGLVNLLRRKFAQAFAQFIQVLS
jgi:hypothetical protein